jgi:hypothetical protein
MKTNAQLLNEITAAMADVWLAACDRRVIDYGQRAYNRGNQGCRRQAVDVL